LFTLFLSHGRDTSADFIADCICKISRFIPQILFASSTTFIERDGDQIILTSLTHATDLSSSSNFSVLLAIISHLKGQDTEKEYIG
jgi:hypothetical protein